jgi:hypothetical protein
MSRRRRSTPSGDFEDPVKNYTPRSYDDGLERALCEESVTEIQSRPATIIPPDTTVQDAMEVLNGLESPACSSLRRVVSWAYSHSATCWTKWRTDSIS